MVSCGLIHRAIIVSSHLHDVCVNSKNANAGMPSDKKLSLLVKPCSRIWLKIQKLSHWNVELFSIHWRLDRMGSERASDLLQRQLSKYTTMVITPPKTCDLYLILSPSSKFLFYSKALFQMVQFSTLRWVEIQYPFH